MNTEGTEGLQSLSLLQARAALAKTPSWNGFGTGEAAEKKRWQASLDFEAMFLGQMYKSMRQTVGHTEFTEPSFAREMFMEMFDKEVASANSRSPHTSGPAGLADAAAGRTHSLAAQIYRSLKNNGAASPLDFGGLGASPSPGGGLPGRPLEEASLKPLVEEAATQYGVPASLLRGVIWAESANHPGAVSPKGAKGLMQLMDSTAAEMGVRNAWDPRDNVMGGAKYLRALLDRFGWNERLALAGYNAGPGAVERHGGVPPYTETQNYVERVLRHRDALDAGGP
jgi:soluble lytic murein transglycosylase-like protein